MDQIIDCKKCGMIVHTFCEAESPISLQNYESEEEAFYICNKCQNFTLNELNSKFERNINEMQKYETAKTREISNLQMKIDNLNDTHERYIGRREKMFCNSLRELGTEETSYHGGDLNGKDCEKLLRHCLPIKDIKDCKFLTCIALEEPAMATNFLVLFQVLGNAWDILRKPPVAG